MKLKLELGCGNQKREEEGYTTIGVDLIKSPTVDVVCNLGFELLPFEDNYFYKVQSIDVFEHIPRVIWRGAQSLRITPFIDLMNEIYRVLKHDGILYMETPFSDQAFRRDPTHVNHFAEDWHHYFKKEDNLYYDQGLIRCNFKLIKSDFRAYKWSKQDILITELVAIKETNIKNNNLFI